MRSVVLIFVWYKFSCFFGKLLVFLLGKLMIIWVVEFLVKVVG